MPNPTNTPAATIDDALATMAKSLDAEVTKAGDPPKPSIVDDLAAAVKSTAAVGEAIVKGELVVSGKKTDKPDEGVAVDEPEEHRRRNGGKSEGDEEDEDKGLGGDAAREDFYKGLRDDLIEEPENARFFDSSPILQAMAKSLAMTVDDITEKSAANYRHLDARIDKLMGAVHVLLKSQLDLHQRLNRTPRGGTQTGMIGLVKSDNGTEITKAGDDGGSPMLQKGFSKADLRDRIAKAIGDGKIEAMWGAKIDTPHGYDDLCAVIAPEILKSYGIPVPEK